MSPNITYMTDTLMTLDETGNIRRTIVQAQDDQTVLVVEVFSNAGFPMFRVILFNLRPEEKNLDAGRFSNFDPKCTGHDIVLNSYESIVPAMTKANQMAAETKTRWGFSYEYNHMGDASMHLQVQDDASAVLLKMMI